MGLEIHEHPKGDERRTTVSLFIAKDKLWLNADKTEVVPDGHADAAFLFASPGTEIPIKEAERYGLVGKARKAPQTKPRVPEEEKAETPDPPAPDPDPAKDPEPPADYSQLDGKALKAELAARGIEFRAVGVKLDVYRELLQADDAAKANG